MNEKAELFLENPVRNPYTSREDPGSENDTKWTGTFTTCLFSEGTQSQDPAMKPRGEPISGTCCGVTAAVPQPLLAPFITTKVASPPPLLKLCSLST